MLRSLSPFARRLKPQARFSSTAKPFSSIPGPPQNEQGSTVDDFIRRITATDLTEGSNSYYFEYGPIVKVNLMGKEEVYVFSPKDLMHVFRNDDPVPKTVISLLWPQRHYHEVKNLPDPLSAPETWKATRSALQKDISSPSAAAQYLPLINEPARRAAKCMNKAPLDVLMPYAAFDMFGAAIFGANLKATENYLNPPEAKNKATDEFVQAAQDTFHLLLKLVVDYSPEGQALKEERLKKYFERMDVVRLHGEKWIEMFFKKTPEGANEPYLQRVIRRAELPAAELGSLVTNFLSAGVDTTSHMLLWVLLNLGKYPEVQEKLYQEIISVVGKEGPVEAHHLEKLDYMRQVFRESHRLTPTGAILTIRNLDRPIELCGYEIPAGTKINIATNAWQLDPKNIDNPKEFRPERWTKEAEKARKGTPQEDLDSLILSKPFSVGPRMCIGARLAETEMKTFLCHMLREWKFEESPKNQPYKVVLKTLDQAVPYPSMSFTAREQDS